jgi:hypothetical protein
MLIIVKGIIVLFDKTGFWEGSLPSAIEVGFTAIAF